MAVTFVGVSASGAASFGQPLTLEPPAGLVEGDLMVADVSWQANVALSSAPAGWTLLQREDTGAPGFDEAIVETYTKTATDADGDTGASPSASYDWTFAADARKVGSITGYTGVHATTPVEDFGDQYTAAGGTSITAPSVTGSNGGLLHVTLVVRATSPGTTDITPPGSLTERSESTSVNDWVTQSTNDEALTADAATGTRVGTSSLAGPTVGRALAIAPTGNSAPDTPTIVTPTAAATVSTPVSVEIGYSDPDGDPLAKVSIRRRVSP